MIFQSSIVKSIIFSIAILAVIVIVFGITTSTEQNPPPFGGGESKGDWIIEDGDDILRENQEIRLEGNLTIEAGGKLTFKNVTLKMNCLKDGEFNIEVQDHGEFYIYDNDNNKATKYDASVFTTVNSEYEYIFTVREFAKMEMKFSEIHESGYTPGKEGLRIFSDDVIIDSNLISENFYGIWCWHSSGIIKNNIIKNNTEYGIYSKYENLLIQGNRISNNQRYGITLRYCDAYIINNLIEFNDGMGIYCYESSPLISKTVLFANKGTGIYIYKGYPEIESTTFDSNHNGTTVNYFGSNMSNCTFTNSLYYDICLDDGSNLTIINTDFKKNKVYFDDDDSNLTVKWYLDVKVIDQYENPIYNANVRIKDNQNGFFDENYTTNSEGYVKLINLTEYVKNNKTETYYTPYNITVEKYGVLNSTDINLDKNKEITIILEREIEDWIVTGTEIRENEEIILTGNLTIKDGGKLTFKNVTLKMNCAEEGEFYIEVQSGGEFYILDNDENNLTTYDASNITAVNPDYNYYFQVKNNGKLEMKNSELHECGYNKFGYEGLRIESDNVLISHNLISDNYYGLDCVYSNITIENNLFYNNQWHAIVLRPSNSTIINNIFNQNTRGIQSIDCAPIILNNTIKNSIAQGIFCTNSEPVIKNSTIKSSGIHDIYLQKESYLTIIDSSFESIEFGDDISNLTLKWYLDVKVTDTDKTPLENINVNIKDNENGDFEEDYLTNKDGWVKWIECTEYVQDSFGKIYQTPHNIKVSKGNDLNETTLNIDENKKIEMILEESSQLQILNVESKIEVASAIITWETNRISNSRVFYGLSESYTNEEYDSELVINHLIELTDLEIGKTYHFSVNSTDEGQKSNYSEDFTFFISDTIPPEITNIEVKQITKNSARIIWMTNELSDSYVHYGKGIVYDLVESKPELVTSHIIDLTGLDADTLYHFGVNSTDEDGNSNQSEDNTFTTLDDTGDAEPPEDPTFSPANDEKVNTLTPIITITFFEEVIITEALLNDSTIINDLETVDYIYYSFTPLVDLPEGENTISIKAKDLNGNEMSNPAISIFIIDTIPPEISEIQVFKITNNSIKITWKTNEPSTSKIQYHASYDMPPWTTDIDTKLVTSHSITIINLKTNITYFYQLISEDECGNSNFSKWCNFTIFGNVNEINIDVSIKINKTDIKENDNITITVNVSNKGIYAIEISIIYMIDDKIIDDENITIAQKKSKDTSIIWKAVKGNHTIKVIVKYDGKEVENGTASKIIEVNEVKDNNGKDSGFNMLLLIPIILIPIIVIIGLLMRNRGGGSQRIQTPQQPQMQQPIPQETWQKPQSQVVHPITQPMTQPTPLMTQQTTQPGIQICQYCNAQVPSEFRFCNMCGKQIKN